MELLKNVLRELHNEYINIEYDIECVRNLIDRFENRTNCKNEDEIMETLHVVKIAIEKIYENIDENNAEFDSAILSVEELV